MKPSIDQLLLLVKEHGAEKALKYIDIETLDDPTLKIIARTIRHSCEALENELVDQIYKRDSKIR